MAPKTNAFKAISTCLIISLLLVGSCGGGGGGPDAAEVEQLLICIVFPLFCLLPAASLDASGHVLNGDLSAPTTDAIGLVSSASDSRGNLYSAGYTISSQHASLDDGARDAVVLKHDPDQNLLWSRRFGSSDSESAEKVSVNSDGSVLVTIVKLRPVQSDVHPTERKFYRLHLSDDGKVLEFEELRITGGM